MVTGERKLLTVQEAERIYRNANGNVDMAIKELHQLPKRRKRPPTPEGGITLMDASRKYKISPSTLSDWLSNKWVKLIKHDGKYKFLVESDIQRLAKADRHPGQPTIAKVG